MSGADPPTTGEVPQAEPFALKTLRNRGRHKIFLGYAPGVGKTFTMLAEAQRRRKRGEDLVVGFVETHGREATAELAEGLPVVPRKKIEYRGRAFEEMDTAAVIARDPGALRGFCTAMQIRGAPAATSSMHCTRTIPG